MNVVRKIVFVTVFLLVLVAGWMFAHGNDATVEIDYVMGRTGPVALWKALVAAAGAGVAVTGIVLGWSLLLARLEVRRYRKTLGELESEVHQLRHLPVVGSERVEAGAATAAAGGGPIGAD